MVGTGHDTEKKGGRARSTHPLEEATSSFGIFKKGVDDGLSLQGGGSQSGQGRLSVAVAPQVELTTTTTVPFSFPGSARSTESPNQPGSLGS